MRGKIGGTAVAFVVTLSMAALSGCSVSFVDALSDSPKANERQRSAGVGGGEGRSHEAEGDSGHSGGADRGAKEGAGKRSGNNPGELTSGDSGESSDEASSGQGTGNEGAPAGEGARPAGHEGLWFDSEPKDPWDKYVWKSQKFIGKGGDIPKLGPGTADKTFWGLPDLCSKQMQKKMKAVGFEFAGESFDDDEMKGCWFKEERADFLSLSSQVLFVYSQKHGLFRKQDAHVQIRLGKREEFVRFAADRGIYSCGVKTTRESSIVEGAIPVEKTDEISLTQLCSRAASYVQIKRNIVDYAGEK